MTEIKSIQEWAIVEVMGHQVYAGYCTEATIAGTAFLRVDIPAEDGHPAFTKVIGPSAIFSLTPCDEVTARATIRRRGIRPFDQFTMQATAMEIATQMTQSARVALPLSAAHTNDDTDDYDDDFGDEPA